MLGSAVGRSLAKLGYHSVGKLAGYTVHTVVIVSEFRKLALGFKIGYEAVFIPERFLLLFYICLQI